MWKTSFNTCCNKKLIHHDNNNNNSNLDSRLFGVVRGITFYYDYYDYFDYFDYYDYFDYFFDPLIRGLSYIIIIASKVFNMTTHNSHTIENHPTKESSNTPKKKRRRGAKARLQAHLRTSSLPSTQTPSTQTPSTAKNNPNNTNNSNNTNNDSSPSKQKKRTKKRIPKAGEEGFMTPTQLRNARKRRAKRSIHVTSTTTTISIPRSMPMSNSNHIRNHDSESQLLPQDSIMHKGKITFSKNDPSMRYIQNPRKAPIVKSAIRFFQHHPTFQSHNRNFQLVLGPLVGWRTVSKLAVRKSMDHKVTIGKT